MSSTETRVVDLMKALEESVAAAKAERDRVRQERERIGPLGCRAVSNDGLVCDMQPKDHGGNMHSGLLEGGDRVWWNKATGDRRELRAFQWVTGRDHAHPKEVDPMPDGDGFKITLQRDQTCDYVSAGLFDAEGNGLTSGWMATPEAALVVLVEKMREKFKALGHTSVRSVREDGNEPLYLFLARLFA